MEINEYQIGTRLTAVYPPDRAIEYCALKLAGEAAEVGELIGKLIRGDYGDIPDLKTAAEDPVVRQKFVKELGDVMWYAARLADEYGISMDEILLTNQKKLLSRKKRGTLKGSGDDR